MTSRYGCAQSPLRHNRVITVHHFISAVVIWMSIGSVVSSPSQIITGISKEHARHLWYVSYIDDFGIGYVEWQYGELNVHSNSSTYPLYLELTADEWHSEGASSRRTGSPLNGADSALGRLGRSRVFSYSPGSRLSFYRLWHAMNADTTSARPPAEVVARQRSWADVRWTVSPGMIVDTMLVALWLVDARTGQKLVQLDSVGVIGSTTDAIARRTGSRPDRSIHSVTLPDSYAGRAVCVEPVPYRYGTTPFGLFFIKRFSTFNMSSLFEREDEEPFPGPLPRSEDYAFSASIDSVYGHDLRSFYAESYVTDTCPPTLLCLYSLDQHHLDALNAFLSSVRFRRNAPDCQQRAMADSLWWTSTLVGAESFGTASSVASIPINSADLVVRDVSNSGCSVSLERLQSPRCTYRVLSSTGHPISVGVIGSAPFTDKRLDYSSGGWQAATLIVTLADGTTLRASLLTP